MIFREPLRMPPGPARQSGFVAREAEDAIARLLLRPHFDPGRETALLAGFDSFDRLLRLECAGNGSSTSCSLAPASWRRLVGSGVCAVLIAHNHPSGAAWPSRADLDATRAAAALLQGLAIDLSDHLIFVECAHFSFRRAGLL